MHGHPLVMLHKERGTKRDESTLHKRFSMCRAEGEWFRPTPALLEYVDSRKRLGGKRS